MTAAEICATYIYDQDVMMMDYSDHIDSGKDPRDHVMWSAAEVLQLIELDGFQEELAAWEAKQAAKK